jgi:hypothetical protein
MLLALPLKNLNQAIFFQLPVDSSDGLPNVDVDCHFLSCLASAFRTNTYLVGRYRPIANNGILILLSLVLTFDISSHEHDDKWDEPHCTLADQLNPSPATTALQTLRASMHMRIILK